MKAVTFTWIVVSIWIACATMACAAVLITPTSLLNSSGVSEFFPAANLINNSGLSSVPTIADYNSVSHAAADAATSWTTDNVNGTGDYFLSSSPGPVAVFTLSLGATYNVSDFVFWGYHFGAPNGNESREFSLEFSTNGGSSYGSPVVVANPLSTYAAANAHTLSLGGARQADTVRLSITDNHFGGTAAGGDRLGLGEVKFIGTLVPEPSVILIFLLAGLTLLRRRR